MLTPLTQILNSNRSQHYQKRLESRLPVSSYIKSPFGPFYHFYQPTWFVPIVDTSWDLGVSFEIQRYFNGHYRGSIDFPLFFFTQVPLLSFDRARYCFSPAFYLLSE